MAKQFRDRMMVNLERAMKETEKKESIFEPVYMICNLKQTTKKRYEEMKRSDRVTASRPNGFMYEDRKERIIFINEDNVYYETTNLSPYYTKEMFMRRQTTGVEEIAITQIVFTEMKDQVSASR